MSKNVRKIWHFTHCIGIADMVCALLTSKLVDFRHILRSSGTLHLGMDYYRDTIDTQYQPLEDQHISKRIQMDTYIHYGHKRVHDAEHSYTVNWCNVPKCRVFDTVSSYM